MWLQGTRRSLAKFIPPASFRNYRSFTGVLPWQITPHWSANQQFKKISSFFNFLLWTVTLTDCLDCTCENKGALFTTSDRGKKWNFSPSLQVFCRLEITRQETICVHRDVLIFLYPPWSFPSSASSNRTLH